ncbi:MAG TPA: hypothetical protein VHJ83_11555 [Micromonosporaceae bacterium]|nr:hypothetical protein [Micromonosporaceae bacterium]
MPQGTGTSPLPGQAAVPPRSPAPDDEGQMPVNPEYVSAAVSRGLIVGGTAGFVVSVIGMMLVGWLRRRV